MIFPAINAEGRIGRMTAAWSLAGWRRLPVGSEEDSDGPTDEYSSARRRGNPSWGKKDFALGGIPSCCIFFGIFTFVRTSY